MFHRDKDGKTRPYLNKGLMIKRGNDKPKVIRFKCNDCNSMTFQNWEVNKMAKNLLRDAIKVLVVILILGIVFVVAQVGRACYSPNQ